ncbi:NAD(P)-dependent dehydrogenase (short-subunit alcohol dehydrogenase family) [Thermocatellispora tengchongensis]|uniref:NAD(P)-dependent dehydrogenase (Short-subunit alcohol dehydrogenase family) n=1 Tax=Thermocatellispora tengchongensis TaxID=1073253 RepID=A0A840NZ73_9ACTN|nr:SDR family oxidoreductase [Thermocatellispora tengchongensis]MBB5130440.1 NAD(P)-dependent dehydrogenase (short-subunit alcohol dehydrogenase family) [Thermocatellispora tengchongensis]
MTRFTGKTVLISGASAGIGRALALGFAAEGATVIAAARGEDALKETVRLIEAEGGRAEARTVDVADSASVAALISGIVAAHGRLDIAVNNAGVLTLGRVEELPEAEWERMFRINTTGVFHAMKHQIAAMRAGGRGGVIINMSSSVGEHIRVPGMAAYGASKAAVTALSRTAALECIGDGIRINSVSPGPHDTTMSMRPGETEADRAERMRTQLPIGRVGTLDEITGSVLWLASPAAGFAVGLDLVLDGGGSL